MATDMKSRNQKDFSEKQAIPETASCHITNDPTEKNKIFPGFISASIFIKHMLKIFSKKFAINILPDIININY